MNSFYNNNDYPSVEEQPSLWKEIDKTISPQRPLKVFHWKSFWMGNAAAVLIGFALLGAFSVIHSIRIHFSADSPDNRMYETLTAATDQLKGISPILVDQASDERKADLRSTMQAISEIDKLIEEIRKDILINGETPAKRENLKRLYATKLDFYKDILLKEDLNS